MSPNGLLYFRGNYITIDGSNSTGGTSRDLTFTQNNNSGTPYVLQGISVGTVQVHDITVKNTVCLGNQPSSTGDVVFTATTTTAGILDPGYFYNISIINNDLRRSNFGVAIKAVPGGTNGSGTVISNNLINNITTPIYNTGIFAAGINGGTIDHNTVGNFYTGWAGNGDGILISSGCTNVNVTNNIITNISNTNLSAFGGYGPHAIDIVTGTANANILVSNNMISGIGGYGADYATATLYNPIGILIYSTQTGIKVYHNSINLQGSLANSLYYTNGAATGILMLTGSSADLRNNIIVNNMGKYTGSPNTPYGAVGILCVSASQLTNCDNNIYSLNPSSGNKYFGQIYPTSYSTFPAWQTAIANETWGLNTTPTFTSSTDLHLTASPSTANFYVNNEGTPLAAVTTDIDGDPRNTYTPDPGADEFKGTGSWIGKTSTVWELPGNTGAGGNWDDGIVPVAGINVKVYDAPNQPTVTSTTGTGYVNRLLLKNPAYITVQDSVGTLQVGADFNVRSSGYINASLGTLDMEGTVPQDIPAGLLVSNSLMNFVVGNTDATTGVNMLGPVDVYRSLTFTGTGLKLTTNNNLTIKSKPALTAWVGDLTGKAVTGNVTAERYFSYLRKWQFLSVPTNTAQTFKSAWQEGAATITDNFAPGYGMEITQMTGGSGSGFDAFSPSGPSVKTYNTGTNDYTTIANTTDPIVSRGGYMTYVRGDRLSLGVPATTTNPTTLRTKGPLYAGTLSPVSAAAGKWVAVGNPYASAIDLSALSMSGLAGTLGTKGTVWLWDPSLTIGTAYGLGGFQTLTWNTGTSTFDVTPGGGSLYAGSTWKRIESGQAFFVKGGGSGGSVTFGEAAKVSSSKLVSFTGGIAGSMTKMLRINLYATPGGGTPALVDGSLIYFAGDFSNGPDEMDAGKLSNTGENAGLRSYGRLLAVDYRNIPADNDTVFINMANTRLQSYQWEVKAADMQANGRSAFFHDKFTNTDTQLDLAGNTYVNFSVANTPGSYAADRFYILFKQIPLPVRFISIAGKRNADKTITVDWALENEKNMSAYEIENSSDGVQFSRIGIKDHPGNNFDTAAYSFNDAKASAAVNYYRVRAIKSSGEIFYCDIVKVEALNTAPYISISPNPVTGGKINLIMHNIPAGEYNFVLFDNAGRLVMEKTIRKDGADSEEKINIHRLAAGIYHAALQGGTVKYAETLTVVY